MGDALGAFIEDLAEMRRVDLSRLREALNGTIPDLQRMAECPQDPVWHAEGDVLIHTQMVMDKALVELGRKPPLSKSMLRSVYLAALLHDVGKPATTHESRDGRIISPGHSKAGLPLARSILYKLGAPYDVCEQTIALIFHHMTAYRLAARTVPDYTVNGINIELKKYRRLSTEVDLRALYHLTRADWLGREGRRIERTLSQIETFRQRSLHYGLWNRQFEGVLDEKDLKGITPSEKEQSRIKHELICLSLAGRVQTCEDAFKYIDADADLIKPSSARLFVAVGVPGCGKSTWFADNLKDVRIISSDAKREEIFGDANCQTDNARVFNECYKEIENALRRGETAALDATNIRRSQRMVFLNLARRLHAHTTIVYFDLPLETALERNRKRDRQVPEAAIAKYFRDLNEPRRTESQELIVVRPASHPAWD